MKNDPGRSTALEPPTPADGRPSDTPADDPARVEPSDVDSAVAFWRKFAPPAFRGLIVAGSTGRTTDDDDDEAETT